MSIGLLVGVGRTEGGALDDVLKGMISVSNIVLPPPSPFPSQGNGT